MLNSCFHRLRALELGPVAIRKLHHGVTAIVVLVAAIFTGFLDFNNDAFGNSPRLGLNESKSRSNIHLKTLKFPVIFLKTLNLGGHPPTPGGVSMSLVPPYITIFSRLRRDLMFLNPF